MSDEHGHSPSPGSDDSDDELWGDNTKDYGRGYGSDSKDSELPGPEPAESLSTEADEPRPAPSAALGGPIDEYGGPTSLDLGGRELQTEDTTFDDDATVNESTRVDIDLAAALKSMQSRELGGSTEPIPVPIAKPDSSPVAEEPAVPVPAEPDPFEVASAQYTIPDVIPAAAVETTTDAPKPLSDIEATPELRTSEIAPEPEEDVSATTALPPMVTDVDADLSVAQSPEPLPSSPASGPKGTLVLEESDISADPATLPPAFPQTTGNVLIADAPKPAAVPPSPPPESEPAEQPDAWEGYDESGGWHSITGESQVVMVEPEPMEVAPSPSSGHPVVFDSSADIPAEERAQLIGVQGADTGRRHSISGDEALIGRSSRCTIVLAEPSVSRQHARIERRPDGFYVVDLESGNGTFVNGQRVAEERIFSGDEVTFGNGTFQFIETGDRFEPVDASAAPVRAEAPRPLATAAPFSRPLAFVVASAVMLLVVGGVIITLQVSDSRRTEALNQAFSRWRAGVNFFKTRDWDRAEALFNQALEVVPDHKRSLRYLDAIHREREAEKLVSEADTALSQKELETAYVLAVRATESIAYGARAREVLREVDAIVDRRVERARNALRGGRTGAVKKELAGLEFIEPYRREIFRLKNTKSAEGAAPERPPKKGGGAVDDNRSGSANDSRNEESAARSAFIQGDLRQAREIATDGGLRELADRLARFSTHLANGTEAVQARRGRTAVRPLESALALEKQIAGGRSTFAKRLKQDLSGAHYLRAVEFFNAERYPEAFDAARLSLQYDRENEQTRRMVNILAQRANEILQAADRIARTDRRRARAMYTDVTGMVPSGDPAHRRARQALRRRP